MRTCKKGGKNRKFQDQRASHLGDPLEQTVCTKPRLKELKSENDWIEYTVLRFPNESVVWPISIDICANENIQTLVLTSITMTNPIL